MRSQRQVDAVRARRSELENHIIDEYRSGYIGRREFIRRGTVVGMSLPLVSFLVTACGSGEKTSDSGAGAEANKAKVAPGGTIKFGLGTAWHRNSTRSRSTTRARSPPSASRASS